MCEDIAGKDCGLKKVIDIIGGKWKIMILCVMDKEGTIRYGDLRRRIFGITNTMLANSLKEMASLPIFLYSPRYSLRGLTIDKL